jgi:hypothetical protein
MSAHVTALVSVADILVLVLCFPLAHQNVFASGAYSDASDQVCRLLKVKLQRTLERKEVLPDTVVAVWLMMDASNKGGKDLVAKQAVVVTAAGAVNNVVLAFHLGSDKRAEGAAVESEAAFSEQLGPNWFYLVRGATTDNAGAATGEAKILLTRAEEACATLSEVGKCDFLVHTGHRDPTRVFDWSGWKPTEAALSCNMHAVARMTHDITKAILGSSNMKDDAGMSVFVSVSHHLLLSSVCVSTVSCLLPAACCLLPADYCLLTAACCLLSFACCLLTADCCLLPADCCLLPATCCLLPAACCLLHAACCLLSAVCCLLSAVC